MCTPPPGDVNHGKVPLKFGNLSWVDVDPQETLADNRFRFADLYRPYPGKWLFKQRSAYISVPASELALGIGKSIDLSQGVPGCSQDYKLKLKDLYLGRFDELPEPPCQTYKVVAVNVPAGLSIRLRKGCMLSSESVPLDSEGAICVSKKTAPAARTSALAVPPTLSVEVAFGFDVVDVTVRPEEIVSGSFGIDIGQLIGKLSFPWPFASRTPMDQFANEAPRYEASSIKLIAANGQSCGELRVERPAANALPRVPKLADFGCTGIPAKADILFVKAGETRGVPSAAFIDDRVIQVTIGQTPPAVRLEELKKELDIRFTTASGQDYDGRLGSGVRNAFTGPHLFGGENCGSRGESIGPIPFIADNGPPRKARYPLYAMMFDRNSEALTRCAKSKVESDDRGAFLTFEFEESRAAGPRRLIVVAAGQQMINANRAMRKAIETSLAGLVDSIDAAKKRGARLSPINIMFVRGDGVFEEVAKGEEAAFDPATTKQTIFSRQTNVTPETPDLILFERMPQAKDFDRIIIIMDGTTAGQTDRAGIRVVQDWAGNLNRKVILLMTSASCPQWVPAQSPNLECHRIGVGSDDIAVVMKPIADRLISFVEQPVAPAPRPAPAPPPRRQ
jgi:hypothetical protein